MLLSLCCTVFFAAGCSRETASGDEQAFTLFMNSIRNGQFTEAFSFISAHVAPENAVDDSIEAYKNTITLAQFEKRYESLFSLLGVNDIEYNIAEENVSGNSKKVIKYTMTYKTQSAGDLTNEYEMTLLKENNLWRVVPHFSGYGMGRHVRQGNACGRARRYRFSRSCCCNQCPPCDCLRAFKRNCAEKCAYG